jgi:uncharacterized protein YcbK (DUF882 family)
MVFSRRKFLKFAAVAAAVYPFKVKKAFASQKTERSLNLYNVHTRESLDTRYFASGEYDYKALDKINYLLRCHYTNKVKAIDVGVLDLLCDIRETLAANKQLKIISGYRSPEYNEYLAGLGRHVAGNSLHLQGLAIDFAIDGIGTSKVSSIARSFASGGVGSYPEFVHIDVGRIRYW